MARLRKRERARQVFRWLQAEFPTRYDPVRLRIERMPRDAKDCEAMCICEAPGLIRIAPTLRRGEMVLAVIHEWAHLRETRVNAAARDHAGDHGPRFWLEYGRLEAAFWANLKEIARY